MSVVAPGLVYTAMTEADLDGVAAAEAELHSFPWSRAGFAGSLAAGHWAWLARQDGQMLGYAVVMPGVDESELLDIGVLKPWQGRGLGAEFLEFLLQQARAAGRRAMLLEVRASNAPALALYARCGFQTLGRRKGYYPAQTGREDALIMELPL